MVATPRAPGDAPAFCGMATALKFGRTGKRGDYSLRRGAYIARASKSQGDTDIGRERLPQYRVQARRQLLDRAGIAVDAVDDFGAGLADEALDSTRATKDQRSLSLRLSSSAATTPVARVSCTKLTGWAQSSRRFQLASAW